MRTKTTVAFSVIFMADLEKRLLMAKPLETFGVEEFFFFDFARLLTQLHKLRSNFISAVVI